VSSTVPELLADAADGAHLLVTRVSAGPASTLRLRELGVCEGRTLRILHTSDPIICQIDQARVGLARRLAEHVHVRAAGARAADAQSVDRAAETRDCKPRDCKSLLHVSQIT